MATKCHGWRFAPLGALPAVASALPVVASALLGAG